MSTAVVTANKGVFRGLNLRQKTLLIIGLTSLLLLTIVFSSVTMNEDSLKTDFGSKNLNPSAEHPFGTDWMGRDMFIRTVKGLGLSILVGAFASTISTVLAVVLGLLSSAGKVADSFVSWLVDLFLSIPHLLLIILISIGLGGGAYGVIMGVALTHWTSLTRVVRAEIKQLKTQEYIHISRNLGKSKWWIATKHILPHLIPQILLGTILMFPHAILHEASVTFLGFGLSPHEPAIGIILSESMKYLSAGYWWLAFFPGLSLLIVVLAFDMIGDNLGKIIDPKTAHE
ncbi:ABC transporter permease [Methanosarcina mazei]|uniref:ABC transporter permease n=2 Tax=Methanosarcina mazei TaxID=2209 RepID=A0A0F8GIE4_METMZ|nr:ABC transporter permease [Methanosarcina mazei]AGF95465.1 Dipeptide transport system permease protein DppC [Methanosarcina mazei Tuc01]KKG08044.1 peptide ABC transporter permease [Methanosarcina mazei]KKG32827.1 peptide ABC transporter permease [Methanosarcina mazei]KKG54559.1 peptide ABC transporter permease [Methanosarcina mazei]KKG61577.1 peptide ABC transporter permease [Methanosarcina mazei]